MALSKNKIKYFNSLTLKKNRDSEQVFIAEGLKLVGDLLPYFRAKYIVATSDCLANYELEADEIIVVESLDEMKKISQLSTPSPIFVVFARPQYNFDIEKILNSKALILALDSVQDPGNLGTIIRIADWFGIQNIICSHGTVDVYNLLILMTVPSTGERMAASAASARTSSSSFFSLANSSSMSAISSFLLERASSLLISFNNCSCSVWAASNAASASARLSFKLFCSSLLSPVLSALSFVRLLILL